jgi:3',5'-nucleoside bisphosphate phosphatase
MIDLHSHSTASDGTTSPADLVRGAADAGLTVIALTDHDTTAGWAPAAAALPAGLTLVPGAELSCKWFGGAQPVSLHMLAYLFDPTDAPLAEAMARVKHSRLGRAQTMVERLRADGVPITWADVLADANGGSVGRPHIAAALIRAGLVDTTAEAFRSEWLGHRYRVPKEDLEVFAAVALVRAAGGVTVFAHPRATTRGPVVPDSMIEELAAAGLSGLEVDHHDHSARQRAEVRALADRLGLVATGSSDYHGRHKTVRLGEQTTAPEAFERLISGATGATVIAGVGGSPT